MVLYHRRQGLSTPAVENFFHLAVGAVGFQHDFPFDHGILKGGVAFDEIIVTGDEAVNDFGGHPHPGRLVLGHVAPFLAILAVGGGFGEGLCHLHGIPDFKVPQNPAIEAIEELERGVQCVNIEPGVMGDNRNHVFLPGGRDNVHQDFTETLDFPLARGNVRIIPGELFRIVAGFHPLILTEEDFPDDIGLLGDHRTRGRFHHRIADIIGQIVAGRHLVELFDIAGFGIQYEQTSFHSSHLIHFFAPFREQ